jgi:hypothetical protein
MLAKEEAYYYTKAESRDRGLIVKRGHSNRLLILIMYYAKSNLKPYSGALLNNQPNYRFKWVIVVAATNYKIGRY